LIAEAEELCLRKNLAKQDAKAPDKINLAALAKLQAASHDFMERDQQATIATLKAQALRYETAIDKTSQGVCFFDGEERLILCNRRYAEIYHLEPEDVSPGTTLREITERRSGMGTCPMAVDDYLAWCASVNSGTDAKTWTAELKDGRTIHFCHQPMPDGGWIATHEDISELKTKRSELNERISLQALIDFVPDYLWVRDTESRFIVVNKALMSDSGRAKTSDLVGMSDLDLHAPEIADVFLADEQEILHSGQPVNDKEEYVVDATGITKWLLSTKVPLRDDHNEIFGLVGIARDITERRKADTLRNGQAQILEMIALSAELGEGLYQGHRRRPHRSQSGLVRHRRLPARSRHRKRYHARSALGGLSRIGRSAWLLLTLVNPGLVASRHGAWRLRDVFVISARTNPSRNTPHRSYHPHCRHRHRTQTRRRPDQVPGPP
jgi:PAS domain S-box-containing protein